MTSLPHDKFAYAKSSVVVGQDTNYLQLYQYDYADAVAWIRSYGSLAHRQWPEQIQYILLAWDRI